MKHMFLPIPIDTVSKAWEDWRSDNKNSPEHVRILETTGGCFLVTSTGKPPRVFVDLLKTFLASGPSRTAAA